MAPSLNMSALRAIEASARLRSYSLAAQELHVTHSAVSHQIRQVESQLGVALFTRVRSQMVPTSTCERLVVRLRRGLIEIDFALREAVADGADGTAVLYLNAMADFADAWLIRRLGDFAALHQHITLALSIHTGIEPPNPNSFDVGIWHRRVAADGFASVQLPPDRVIAVCSAEFGRRHPQLSVESLPTVPLLRFGSRSWREFFQVAGVSADEPSTGPIFADAGALLGAAKAGLGVAMIRRRMADAGLRGGSLVQVGEVDITAHLDYFFTWRERHSREADIELFRDWLFTQLVSSQSGRTTD